MIAYCWERPKFESTALAPMVRLWHDRPGKDPKVAAKEAIDRVGGVCERYALADQPPQGGEPRHTYSSEFGPGYGDLGTLDGAYRQRDWMIAAFAELRDQGFTHSPDRLTLDYEGWLGSRMNYRDAVEVERRARIRARYIEIAVIEPAALVWGRAVRASNYEDRRGLYGDFDPNGAPYTPVGVSEIIAGVYYEAPLRKQTLDRVKAAAAMTAARARDLGQPFEPWANSLEVTRWLVEVLGVERLVLWGSDKSPSYAAQEWIAERAEVLA